MTGADAVPGPGLSGRMPAWGAVEIACAIFAVSSAAYFAVKLALGGTGTDFTYFWLAGLLWADGLNPYSAVFENLGEALFATDQSPPVYWVYPPNWWPLSVGLSQFSYDAAGQAWNYVNAISILGGIAAALCALRPPLWLGLFFTGATLSMLATAQVLALGQTSALMFFGTGLFILAWIRESRLAMVSALVLLALKPTFGLVFVVFLLPMRRWRASIAMAGAVTLAMALPTLLETGAVPVIEGMLSRLELYGTLPVNEIGSTTGLRHLLSIVAGMDVGVVPPLVIVCGLSFGLGLAAARQPGRAVLAPLIAALVAIVPMHSYDAMVLSFLLVLSAGQPKAVRLAALVLFLAIYRADNLAELVGWVPEAARYFPGSALVTVFAGALLVLFLAAPYRRDTSP